MTGLVLDASVAAIAVVEATPQADALRSRFAAGQVHAPHLIDAEVGTVLRRRAAAESIRPEQAAGALRALATVVTDRYPHGPLARAAWSLRHNLSYYDALYAALAARLRVPLLTADARLARAPGLPCAVEVVA